MIDVGANTGQYATRLRAAGWAGPILSHRAASRRSTAGWSQRAAADPDWEVAPADGGGCADGEVELEVSAESDMSSTLRADGPAAGRSRRPRPCCGGSMVPQRRLDGLARRRPALAAAVRQDRRAGRRARGARRAWTACGTGSQGLQLELALLPLYEGERPWLELLERPRGTWLRALSVVPGLFLERALGRQVQLDAVLYRA